MSVRLCPSCDYENPGVRVYCTRCGGILSALPIPPKGGAFAPVEVSVVRKLEATPLRTPHVFPPLSFFMRIVNYWLSVALGVILVLIFMPPSSSEQRLSTSGIVDPSAAMERVFLGARSGLVELSQPLINDFLRFSGTSQVTVYDPIHLMLKNARVKLFSDALTYSVEIVFFGCPFHLSENFLLRGTSRHWSLEGESASLGLLPIPSCLIPYLTAFIAGHVSPAIERFKSLTGADELKFRHGAIDFSVR